MQIARINPQYTNTQLNSRNVYTSSPRISFTGTPPVKSNFFAPVKKFLSPVTSKYKELYSSATEYLAKGLGKLIDTKFFTEKMLSKKMKNSKNLFNHLMTIGSVILSSIYVGRTLTNKKLDEKKRNTLAINQGIVFAISTAMCYLVEGNLKKAVTMFTNKFEAVNAGRMDKALLGKCVKGASLASKIIVFDTIYRFIAPVFVTPIANKIGNNVAEKKEAEHAAKA